MQVQRAIITCQGYCNNPPGSILASLHPDLSTALRRSLWDAGQITSLTVQTLKLLFVSLGLYRAQQALHDPTVPFPLWSHLLLLPSFLIFVYWWSWNRLRYMPALTPYTSCSCCLECSSSDFKGRGLTSPPFFEFKLRFHLSSKFSWLYNYIDKHPNIPYSPSWLIFPLALSMNFLNIFYLLFVYFAYHLSSLTRM